MSERFLYGHPNPCRNLLFDRIKTLSEELGQLQTGLAEEADARNAGSILLSVGEIDSRIQSIRHIVGAIEECFPD